MDRVKNSVEKKIEFMEENNVFLKDNKEDVLGEQKLTGANGRLKAGKCPILSVLRILGEQKNVRVCVFKDSNFRKAHLYSVL